VRLWSAGEKDDLRVMTQGGAMSMLGEQGNTSGTIGISILDIG